MRFLLVLVLLVSSAFSLEYFINSKQTTNARTQYVELDKKINIKYDKILIKKRVYPIYKHPIKKDKFYALIPMSYYQKPNTKKVEIVYSLVTDKGLREKKEPILIQIKDADYKKEKIQVQKSKVNPKSKNVKSRTAKEYKEAMAIYGHYSNKSYIKKKFILPMESKITSDFGKARVYNDELKGYNSGTDFRAKIGTDILASNDGKIVLVQNRFYSGNSVIIDHGQGIYTCYYHMSEFKVKRGDMVKQGQVIGLSGDTGRVTGPHLHFSARVAGIQVDPLQLIELLNKNLLGSTIK